MVAGSTGANLFVKSLEQYGVTHVFGNPGTTELPVIRSLIDSDIKYILGLHEDIAVGMAGGYASTRRYHAHHDSSIMSVGVASLHLAPGLAHGLGNLYNARIMGAPLVVTAGNYSRDALHEEPILSGDLVGLADQFTKWSAEVQTIEALPAMVRRAFRIALTPPTGPVFLSLPLDVMVAETDARPERLGPIPNAGSGDPAQINRAAELLARADHPILVVGDGVAHSGTAAVEAAINLAEVSGMGVHGEIYASEVDFPTDHEQWLSYLPLANDALARELLSTDTLLLVGCSTNTTFLHQEGELIPSETTCVHITDEVFGIGKNQPADAAVVGDAGLIMSALAERVQERLTNDTRASRVEWVADRKAALKQELAAMTDRGTNGSNTEISRVDLVDAMREAAPDAFIVDEGLTAKLVLLTRWVLSPEQYLSNKGLGLGYGLPAAVGAAIAETEAQRSEPKPVIGFIGDGSYLYYPHTLYTAARYGVDLTIVIPDNRSYQILENNYFQIFDDEKISEFNAISFDPPVDIPMNAKSHGATARRVETTDELAEALESGLATAGPAVLDAVIRE